MSSHNPLALAAQRLRRRAQVAHATLLIERSRWHRALERAELLLAKTAFVALLLLLGGAALQAQIAPSFVTTVRGTVVDKDTRQPLAGATVQLQPDGGARVGTVADERGAFVFKNVKVGRLSLTITYIGYTSRTVPNLLATTGREVLLDLDLVESVVQTETVEISSRTGDESRMANNELSLVSASSFSPEQAMRYAGSLADPTRVAANFAGVAGGGDTRNDLVIRGNSPMGMLWRLEGIDIFNPNHFATQGANGGPISLLNNNTLGGSDFITGAFAAEYGNATAGVFDLRLRNGNVGRRQSLFAIGFNGFEFMTEGPFKRGGQSTYLINYRYSTLDIFNAIGISFGDLLGIPRFQDLSIKLNFPTQKFGTFGLFAVGGASRIAILESDLTTEEFIAKDPKELSFTDVRQFNQRGTIGATHAMPIGSRGLLKTVLAAGVEERTLGVDTLANERQVVTPLYNENVSNYRLTASLQYTHKFSAQHTLRLGTIVEHHVWKWNDRSYFGSYLSLPRASRLLRDIDSSAQLYRVYAQYSYRPTERLTLTAGVHGQYYSLNEQFVTEPRAAVRYSVSSRSTISLAYGMHHQIQPVAISFSRATDGSTPMTNLDFTRSHHFVLGYELSIGDFTRLKAETYYQSLSRIPIDRFSSSFSSLNVGLGFARVPDHTDMANNGTANNVGLELTLERFLHKGFYYLVTGSVFRSRYKGSDGVERPTAFDNQYVVNALLGLELPSGKSGQNAWILDLKVALAGGIRYTPIDVTASQAAGAQVDDNNRVNALQTKPYFRPDLKFGYRFNYSRWSQEIAVTLQNFLGVENVLTLNYNPRSGTLVERSQLGFFPVVQYTLRFQGKE